MSSLNQLSQICQRLAPFGWATLLKRHGLDILAPNLENEIYKDISGTIDRSIPGFEDFISSGHRAIEPYVPCKSLLLHALSSQNVHPGPGNTVVEDNAAYPSIDELDVLENFIFSVNHAASGAPVRDKAFFETNFGQADLVFAIFAYQYRTGSRSVNTRYADFVYSRTGIARTGTTSFCYVPSRRTFWTIPGNDDDKIPVLPARYGVYLAQKRKARQTDEVVHVSGNTQGNLDYVFPIHKIFPGRECVSNVDIPHFKYAENHVSEKLKRAFSFVDASGNAGFQTSKPPFSVSSKAGDQLVTLQNTGASSLVVPLHSERLVHMARQGQRVVSFSVPPADQNNRFFTSFQILAEGRVRMAPEYLNIRFELMPNSSIENLSDQFSNDAGFLQKIANGGYQAVQFADHTCDGCIVPEFEGAPPITDRILAAYSLVTAPDFFPLCDQLEINQWLVDNGLVDRTHFAQGGPEPLSENRIPVNPLIEHPLKVQPAFPLADNLRTTTALVGMSVFPSSNAKVTVANQQVSFLTDGASGVFAPGWDVSLVGDPNVNVPFFGSFGLGSPFPEDSKLCAALNSFWPAVAPDASRTFLFGSTSFPMLDSELGYHTGHPLVRAGKVQPTLGWDGEQGPFFEGDFAFVNHTSINRSDYTANALNDEISVKELSAVDAKEWIRRMTVLRNCISVLPPKTDIVSDAGSQPQNPLKLIVVAKVEDWAREPGRADQRLFGEGYLFQFAATKGGARPTTERKRLRTAVARSYTCQISDTFIFWKENADVAFNMERRATLPI
ncbi:hypothetical protein SAMN04487996_122167 [Dyadobacter soli]|uniref:Uncharacterized protein n=1 Tax=Dyadobacter soli TaxID=659014 RepID=A0A1G7WU46_9BACT|nr:hypothetical protein [Dyadobacter soli]SDG75443.1 hypothetical protein SAMN04487996_122167 [Dyadobacter soli]